MRRIKSSFSIKNLENISGIKAHTLTIWEKRYNLLKPERTDTNIRRYSLDSLRKLINITFFTITDLKFLKLQLTKMKFLNLFVNCLKSNSEQVSINAFKLAMVNFDMDCLTNFDEILAQNDLICFHEFLCHS